MNARLSEKSETVARCVPRHDGGYLVVLRSGGSAVSAEELPEGARVVIREGRACRPEGAL